MLRICITLMRILIRIPDPACHFDADPDQDLTFHFDPDPFPGLKIKAENLEKVLN
jgi:hypothetical protein